MWAGVAQVATVALSAAVGPWKVSHGALVWRRPDRFADWQKSTVELVADILQSEGIDAEKTGQIKIGFAHRPNRAEGMRRYVEHSNKTFGTDYSYMDRDQCREHRLAGPQVHGGYVIPDCFGIHPMKYVRGLAHAAQKHGVVIHEHAPVGDWRRDGDNTSF